MLALPIRHLPFGVSELALQRLLARQSRRHKQLSARRTRRLQRLQTATAELTQYHQLLQAELAVLEDEERLLLRALADIGHPEAPPPELPLAPEADPGPQRLTLQHYRALHADLTASVLALIAPFLTDPASAQNRKEEPAWPSIPTHGD